MVDLILETGFDINARTARGTALHEAALCGKIEVVRTLLEAGINLELRDQADKTVLEIMNELKTARTREVIHIILDFMGVRRRGMASVASSSRPAPHSPYDNVSLTQSLDESYSIDLEFGSANTSRARYLLIYVLLIVVVVLVQCCVILIIFTSAVVYYIFYIEYITG